MLEEDQRVDDSLEEVISITFIVLWRTAINKRSVSKPSCSAFLIAPRLPSWCCSMSFQMQSNRVWAKTKQNILPLL